MLLRSGCDHGTEDLKSLEFLLQDPASGFRGIMVSQGLFEGNHPQMALIQVCEIL